MPILLLLLNILKMQIFALAGVPYSLKSSTGITNLFQVSWDWSVPDAKTAFIIDAYPASGCISSKTICSIVYFYCQATFYNVLLQLVSGKKYTRWLYSCSLLLQLPLCFDSLTPNVPNLLSHSFKHWFPDLTSFDCWFIYVYSSQSLKNLCL